MFESEKKICHIYRIQPSQNGETCVARYIKTSTCYIVFTSDRRDVDEDGLGIYLKKTYRGVCDCNGIEDGDIMECGDVEYKVISAYDCGTETLLHLEIVAILKTASYEHEVNGNV